MLGGQAENLPHAPRTDTDEDLVEIAAVRAEEIRARFAGDGLGEHGFAGAGRPYEENALRQFAAETAVLSRVAQEINHFADFGLGFFDAGDVAEPDGGALLKRDCAVPCLDCA